MVDLLEVARTVRRLVRKTCRLGCLFHRPEKIFKKIEN